MITGKAYKICVKNPHWLANGSTRLTFSVFKTYASGTNIGITQNNLQV